MTRGESVSRHRGSCRICARWRSRLIVSVRSGNTHGWSSNSGSRRRILVDHARRNNVKRGHGVQHVPLEDAVVIAPGGMPTPIS